LDKIPAGNTLFEFEHAVFRTPDARFLLGTDRKPCLAMTLGDLNALLPLSSVIREFQLEGTADATLIGTVIAGLKYVKVIRPGDSIPRELLDGTASWRVDDSHLEIAQGRLSLQMNSWLNGQERIVVDATEILQLVDDPAVVARVKGGYGKLAEAVGLDAGREAEIVARLDRLAREIVYIEALRERFEAVKQLQGKLASFRRAYRHDKTIDEELIRINNLILRPIDAFNKVFGEADEHTKSIVDSLKNLDQKIGLIRGVRDRLHTQLMLWDEILSGWQDVSAEISVANEKTIKDLYRFLAQTYLTQKSW
jgi:hypothetical protein